ncbi:MAG: hypothetical protein ISEC1_P1972 [Thiomicrorhabdus sp.]|nr:MAG: hypothetical protein ISEC1_P1972 [Thiomicrorhabdus sp.]
MDLSFLADFIEPIADWVNGYLYEIALAMISTLLVIYGDKILALIKKQIGSLKPFLRITLFVVFCSFGFALLTTFLTPLIVAFIQDIDSIWSPLVVLILFYIIGWLAQKRGFI